jgi:hypothetical protein
MTATIYLHPRMSLTQTLRVMRRENCTTEYDGSHVRLVPLVVCTDAPRRPPVRRIRGLSDSGLARLWNDLFRMRTE